MSDTREKAYRRYAQTVLQRDGELEFDEDAEVTLANGVFPGAYVQAVVWIPADAIDPVRDASPKLLAACEAAILWAETPGNHGGNPWGHAFMKLVEAAVREAKGGKP